MSSFQLEVSFRIFFLLLTRRLEIVRRLCRKLRERSDSNKNNKKKSHTKNIYCFSFDWFMYVETYFCGRKKQKRNTSHRYMRFACCLPFCIFPAARDIYISNLENLLATYYLVLSRSLARFLWATQYTGLVEWHEIKCKSREGPARYLCYQLRLPCVHHNVKDG